MARVLLSGDFTRGALDLRDGGHEVVVLGPGMSPEETVAVALQDEVAAVAVGDTDLGSAVAEIVDDDVVVFSITSDALASAAAQPRD